MLTRAALAATLLFMCAVYAAVLGLRCRLMDNLGRPDRRGPSLLLIIFCYIYVIDDEQNDEDYEQKPLSWTRNA